MNIEEIWQSEETLTSAYKELLSLSAFDRTKDASKLVKKLMQKILPGSTYHEQKQWVTENISDFNLASQILLNCQSGVLGFRVAALEKALEAGRTDGPDSPFAPKAKFRPDDDPTAGEFNRKLAGIRNLKILKSEWIGMNSFRISPLGSTPALADLNNLSSLSINGLRPYCDAARIWLINHEAVAKHIGLKVDQDGAYTAEGLTTPIVSKSGGDIAPKALVSRWLAVQVMLSSNIYVVPKYDSLLVSESEIPEHLKGMLDEFAG